MASPSWLKDSYNEKRTGPLAYLTPYLAEKTGDSDAIWNAWDMVVDPGRYKLSRLAASSLFFNYFVVGTVPQHNQREPIQIKDRLGELYSHALRSQEVRGLQADASVEFYVPDGIVFRIESFACKPRYIDRPRNQNLPSGFDKWIDFDSTNGWQRIETSTFGASYPTVSRRTLYDTSVVYNAEDGIDADFDDIQVELTFVSA